MSGTQDGDLEIELDDLDELEVFEENSGLIDLTDLTDLVEEGEEHAAADGDPPPRLVDDQASLWPAHSGLHSTMLSTAGPTSGAESWLLLVEELAQLKTLRGIVDWIAALGEREGDGGGGAEAGCGSRHSRAS